jgi:adenylate kinase
VHNRLYIYYKETSPLIGYYFAKGLLAQINGEQAIEVVQADLRAVVEAARK